VVTHGRRRYGRRESRKDIHLFPHDIIEVDAVGDNLIVVARSGREGREEGEKHSFKLNPRVVLPRVAEKAQKAGLSIAQYAASEIRHAKAE
jgi:hypothetical protein